MNRTPTSQEIEHLLSRWPTGTGPCSITPLDRAAGLSGASLWRITRAEREYCLRQWPQDRPSEKHLLEIHGLLRHIHQRGLEIVPVPYRSHSGTTLEWVDGNCWELAPWMPGESSSDRHCTPARLAKAVATLARFHTAAQDYGEGVKIARSPGLQRRAELLQTLQSGGLASLQRQTLQSNSPFRELVSELLQRMAATIKPVSHQVQQAAQLPLPLQWSLRDVKRDHVLFTNGEVTGLVDFGAAAVESVAGDLARLIGSFAACNPTLWQPAAEAYSRVRQLTDEELGAIAAFDRGGVLCAISNWARWLVVERRHFASSAAVETQLWHLKARLEQWNDQPPALPG